MQDCILHCFFNFLIICDKGDSVNNVLFELRGITKLFGNVVANKNIDFSVRKEKYMLCWERTDLERQP